MKPVSRQLAEDTDRSESVNERIGLDSANHTPRLWSPPRYTDWTMASDPPTLGRRSFLSAAAAGIVSSPIWSKAITARFSDSQLLSDIEHRTFSFYWERVNHSNGLMACGRHPRLGAR